MFIVCRQTLNRQRWFIEVSLASLAPEDHVPRRRDGQFNTRRKHQSSAELLLAAQRFGDRLEQLTYRNEQGASWVGLVFSAGQYGSLLPLGIDLYSGLPGIALFLANLGAVTGEARYTELAQATVNTITAHLDTIRASITSVGAFNGLGGVIYTLVHLALLCRQVALLDAACELVDGFLERIERDISYDVLNGGAGSILTLLGLYNVTGYPAALNAAVFCGEHLLQGATQTATGVGWIVPGMGREPLAGLSHGAAGVAWALLSLSNALDEGDPRAERYETLALRALTYERSLFSEPDQNWRDLRDFSDVSAVSKSSSESFLVAWCHGAPGIGLARLKCLPLLHAPEQVAQVEQEIAIALHTTRTKGFGFNHSLCHGDLGNVDLLLAARTALGDDSLSPIIEDIAVRIMDSLERDGAICGTPSGIETPGLMMGLAGIGYGLLRLATSDRVPSVLTLELPDAELV
jgi:type 2 lantibiotic biosynthesis protein LanM